MNDMLSSSIWPNSSTSRSNLGDQFSLDSMSAWQPINQGSDIYPIEDYNNVWSDKSEANGSNEKELLIKSIWSPKASPSDISAETNSIGSDDPKLLDETPINSPSVKRIEIIINSNDRWGCVKINQITPWSVTEIDVEKRPHDPMVWRAKVDGTEVWEEYYLKQHGHRRPQTESAFNGDSVWSLIGDLSQSTNSIWPPNNNDASIPSNDSYLQNTFNDINSRSNFNTSNGVRPSMTRNQAQKYLMDMGYSLSDAIGALVNNQMDLPKAINELQSKFRAASNVSGTHNGMYTPTMAFNGRPGDSVNMGRLSSVPPSMNQMMNQGGSGMTQMMTTNYPNNYDMFHSDLNEQQIFESSSSSSYLGMDANMSQYGRLPDTKRQCSMPMARDSSFRQQTFSSNSLATGGGNLCNSSGTRGMVGSNYGQYNQEINGGLSQGMARMGINYNNNGAQPMIGGHNTSYGNKWSGSNSNGYSVMPQSNSTIVGDILRQNYGSGPGLFNRSMSSKPPQTYQRTPSSGLNWQPTTDNRSLSPDINQARLVKNISYPSLLDGNNIGIIIRKVPQQHIEIVKSICFESGAMTNFQLQPQIQSIVVHFNSLSEARRCMSILQSEINARVDFITDDYMHCMPGAR